MSAARPLAPRPGGPLEPIAWVPEGARSLLDVGCNVGAFLSHCRAVDPEIRLAGVEIDPAALEAARQRVPDAELHQAGAEDLPFADESFDCVTCIEVLEHIPGALRRRALAEMRRVLCPGGRLVLRVPHAGLGTVLDPNNLRFRLPTLYRWLVGRGRRDAGYADESQGVVWHHHFTLGELLELAGDDWRVAAVRRGGLFLMPLADLASWPFYRLGRYDHPALRLLHRVAAFDLGRDYGRASYDLLLALARSEGDGAMSQAHPAPTTASPEGPRP
jgi:SAM-dependent methyltransferase